MPVSTKASLSEEVDMTERQYASAQKNTKVDVAVNIFGKPYQTALCVLSLLRHSAHNIGTIFLAIEPVGTKYDSVDLRYIEKISNKIKIFTPSHWIGLDASDLTLLSDASYRHSIRYQYAWEHADSDFLLVAHNDVYFKDDIVTRMLEQIGDAVAVGQIGQCWNCPACRTHIVEALGINGGIPCAPDRYADFACSLDELNSMYLLTEANKEHCRPFLPVWSESLQQNPWPLPECRVNEFCCLINRGMAKSLTAPHGSAPPFGSFVSAGSHNMDVGVAWFRDINRQGLRAKNMDIFRYLVHPTVGHRALLVEQEYHRHEKKAEKLLRTEYPGFVKFCVQNNITLFNAWND